MDPNEALSDILFAKDHSEIQDACENLYNWLDFGGFEPNWREYPKSTEVFRAWKNENT